MTKRFATAALLAGVTLFAPASARADSCGWGNKGDNPTAFGFYWGSTYLLDVDEYLDCWTTPPAQSGYDPVKGQQVVLATFGMWVQQTALNPTPFRLQSLTLGAGWTNNIQLTFIGYKGKTEWTATRSLNVADGLVNWDLGGREFDYFRLLGSYDKSTSEAIDPYQSWKYNKEASGIEEPYQTFFVSGITTVPEPSSYALVGAGLLALGVVARRRKRQG